MCRFLLEIKKRFQHFRNAFNHFGVMKQEVPQNMKQLVFISKYQFILYFFGLYYLKGAGLGLESHIHRRCDSVQ